MGRRYVEFLSEAGASVTLVTHVLCSTGYEQKERGFPPIAAVASETPLRRDTASSRIETLEILSWLLVGWLVYLTPVGVQERNS